jgi:hypothetical protein
MKPTRMASFTVGPLRLFTTVGSPFPFALSLSKGQAELVFPITLSLSKGAFVPQAKGFDKLSPNGSLRTSKFACGPKAGTRFAPRQSREAPWSH